MVEARNWCFRLARTSTTARNGEHLHTQFRDFGLARIGLAGVEPGMGGIVAGVLNMGEETGKKGFLRLEDGLLIRDLAVAIQVQTNRQGQPGPLVLQPQFQPARIHDNASRRFGNFQGPRHSDRLGPIADQELKLPSGSGLQPGLEIQQ